MRKIILAALCATAIGVVPFAANAQMTGPQGQDSTKMGTETGMQKEGMTKTKKMKKSKKSMMKEEKKM
jgi:hypothetical protein